MSKIVPLPGRLTEVLLRPCGEKTQPNRNNLSFQRLRSDRILAFGRLPVLTFGNPGSMVKVSYFTSEQIMSFVLQPWQVVFVALSAWVNQRQQQIIEFQNAEIEALLKKLGKKRILLTDDQRRLLAVQGKALGRKALMQLTTIVAPDTILRWHRDLVAKKWDYSDRRRKKPGRPRVRQVIVDLILRLAKHNPTWGFDRIQGALANVGYHICDTTVGNILKAHGVQPAPDRQRTGSWSTFLKAHWEVLAAIDFTTIEVWTKGGLVTFYLLFVMELKTRRVQFVGCTANPHEAWMKQTAGELTNFEDGFLTGKRYLLMDRDTKFCKSFRDILRGEGVDSVRLPPQSPNLNAHTREVLRIAEIRVLGQNDILRPALTSKRSPPIPGSLSWREKSSRAKQQDHRTEGRSRLRMI